MSYQTGDFLLMYFIVNALAVTGVMIGYLVLKTIGWTIRR